MAEELQRAEFRCSLERRLTNPGLRMTNICIDMPFSEKKSNPAGFFFFFNNYSRLFLYFNKS